jgi:SAM-dependent methyltransferase
VKPSDEFTHHEHRASDASYDIISDIALRQHWANDPDSAFYFDRTVESVFEATMDGARGYLLDVASGDGSQLRSFSGTARVKPVGLELSGPLIGRARSTFERDGIRAALVRGDAQRLPFDDGIFDRIVCQGSLDHFPAPRAFLAEAARVLAPEGRLVIALHNYDSASCRISRALYALRGSLGMPRDDPTGSDRPYWQIPDNHTFRGNLAVLREFAGADLRMERAFGVSMFWLVPSWRKLLRALPPRGADMLLRAADGCARRAPTLGDMIVSVWRPRRATRSRHALAASNGAHTDLPGQPSPFRSANITESDHSAAKRNGEDREERDVISRLALEHDVEQRPHHEHDEQQLATGVPFQP